LFDIRGDEYINDYTYHIKTNVDLPSYTGLSYFAIRYRNTDCSSKWMTVSFDNIAINDNSVGIKDVRTNNININLYPNPANDKVKLEIEGFTKDCDVIIYDLYARAIKTYKISSNQNYLEIDINGLVKGIYNVKVINDNCEVAKKLIVN